MPDTIGILRLIEPVTLQDSNFNTADLQGVDIEPAWSSGSAYAAGDIVKAARPDTASDQFTNARYEAAESVSASEAEPKDNDKWVHLGPELFHAGYDAQYGVDQQRVINTRLVTNGGSYSQLIQFDAGHRVNAAAVYDADGMASMRINRAPPNGTQKILLHFFGNLLPDYNFQTGHPEYFWFGNQNNTPDLLQRNHVWWSTHPNGYDGDEVQITAQPTVAGGVMSFSSLVFGQSFVLGQTLENPDWELNSRSFKSANGLTTSLVRRLPGDRVNAQAFVPPGAAEYVKAVLRRIDGVACYFTFTEDHPEFDVYGIVTEARMRGGVRDNTLLDLTVETV